MSSYHAHYCFLSNWNPLWCIIIDIYYVYLMHNNADVASRMSRMNAILVVSGRVEVREEAGAAETAKMRAKAIEEEVHFFSASIEALMVSTSIAREAQQEGIVLMVDPSSSSSSSSSST